EISTSSVQSSSRPLQSYVLAAKPFPSFLCRFQPVSVQVWPRGTKGGGLCNAFASRPSAGPSPPIGEKASMLDAIAQRARICYPPTFPPKQRQLAGTSSDRGNRCKAQGGVSFAQQLAQ